MGVLSIRFFVVGFLIGLFLLLASGDTPSLATSASDYRQLGLAYREQGNFPEAIAALQKAVALDPDNLSGRVTLGWTQHLAGQDQAAAQTLQTNLNSDLTHVPTLNALGIIYLVNDDLAVAVLTHTWAALLAPANEIPYYNLSLAYQRLHQYDWAIENAQKAMQLEPDNPHPLVALAIAQWGKGDPAIAQQTYQQAIALDSRYADSAFLDFLNEAGFSPDQIELSKQVLRSR